MKTILLALLFAGAAQDGEDAQWTQLHTNKNATVTYYAPASVRRSDGAVRARVRVILGPGISDASEFLATDEIDCPRRTRRTIELVATFGDGTRRDIPVPGTAYPLNPDTAMAALYEIVCAPATID